MPSMAGVKRRVRRAGAIAQWTAAGARTESIRPPADVPAGATTVLYLHHSTGERIWRGGIPELLAAENGRQGTDYRIVERAYPDSPYSWSNDPHDYWRLWVQQRSDKGHLGQATLDQLARDWDVVVVKNCFTTSHMEPDPVGAAASPARRTPTNYRRQMTDLKAVMREFDRTKFLVWTPPPLVAAATSPAAAALTDEYAAWLREEWDEPGDNIYLWDFRAIAASGGCLRPEYATSPTDSHPSAELAAIAAPMFVRRLVDVIQGRGDATPATGEVSS